MRLPSLVLLAISLAASPGLSQAQAPGSDQPIGFSVRVQTAGWFSSKIDKVVIAEVKPQSQAQAAGLAVGDEVLRVEGQTVPGADALALRPYMEFKPGDTKTIVLRRSSGQEYEAKLTRGKVAN